MLTIPAQRYRLIAATLLTTLAAVIGIVAMQADSISAKETATAPRLFEMRTYTTNDGKIEALLSRFRDHTMRIFKKHGMTNVAYWTPIHKDGEPEKLVYVLAYSNREARDAGWKAFIADPQWRKVYRESIAEGKLVKKIDSVFMKATDFSPLQ